jgi:hypothetical protein
MASAAIATAVAAAVLAAPTAAWARYSASNATALSVTADTLAPATSVSFTKRCSYYGAGGSSVTVTWTASTDSYANGYTVSLATSSGTAASTQVSGHNTTAATLPVPKSGTAYSVNVVAGYQQWTSTTATAASTVMC